MLSTWRSSSFGAVQLAASFWLRRIRQAAGFLTLGGGGPGGASKSAISREETTKSVKAIWFGSATSDEKGMRSKGISKPMLVERVRM